ncbi:App1 family protein [Crateriforma conspicua]|uniref:Phosphatidate phosphatase APP1 catalytic domain-containing protein n=1 Tax=Crateriforma conspicua TaxID=2527996 RepID=A0A5C6FHV6_9PLAN|nr:phosphatase domain-containing protein [Crateriforma conspicua]TWU61660.1 hypothetical protein V7x_33480 [Crateriforma conspicua]
MDKPQAHWQDSFHQWARQLASDVDDAFDAGLRKLRKRYGKPGTPQLYPYVGHATRQSIHLSGRVLRNPPLDPDFRNDRWWDNMLDAVRRFASDEVPGVIVRANVGDQDARATSDREGYFHLEVPRVGESAGPIPYWSSAVLRIEGSGKSDVVSPVVCPFLAVPPSARFAVVSDVDDTILHTGATSLMTMAKLTFFGNARTRAPLDGVAEFYQRLQADGELDGRESGDDGLDNDPFNPIFYVSSSPWNLHDLLSDFLELNSIPAGPLLLRDLGIDRDKFIKSGHDHKKVKALRLMHDYPDLPFILIGDSGQEDARLYAEIAAEHPNRIAAILIRDVDPETISHHDQKVDVYVRQCDELGVPMYLIKDSIGAARRLIDQGLMSKQSLSRIEAATARDRQRSSMPFQP